MPRRSLEDLLRSLDEIRPDNVSEHWPLIRDGIRDLGRRFLLLEVMGTNNNHRPPRQNVSKEQKS
jgi:hypothetical protein